MSTPAFPAAWKGIALPHRDALEVYRKEAGVLEWTHFSPSALIEPGERTGKFRTGTDLYISPTTRAEPHFGEAELRRLAPVADPRRVLIAIEQTGEWLQIHELIDIGMTLWEMARHERVIRGVLRPKR
jgi:hypothetical protein